MSHFYFRFMVTSVFLFTAVLLIIHSQPYDNLQQRQLLFPDGCPAPCFMGIRPGVTSVDEAIQILQSSGWTADIQIQPTSRWIIVRWNEQAPAWLLPDDSSNNLALATRDLSRHILTYSKTQELCLSMVLGVATHLSNTLLDQNL